MNLETLEFYVKRQGTENIKLKSSIQANNVRHILKQKNSML